MAHASSPSSFSGTAGQAAPRMLVMIGERDAALRGVGAHVVSAAGTDISGVNETLTAANAQVSPLFGDTEDRLIARRYSAPTSEEAGEEPELELFYAVTAPEDRLDALAAELAQKPGVAGAYVSPAPEPAVELQEAASAPFIVDEEAVNAQQPSPNEAPPASPDFTSRQGYLDPAPGGVDARYAWTLRGGRGWNVRIIDCEGAWRFTHEDLRSNQGGVIRNQTTDLGWRNHGTAVVGEFGGDVNTIGVTGICPQAHARGCSIFDTGGLPGAIMAAADRSRPGDIILIEVQYGHPSRGYTSVEWWPADFAAIRYAVNRGIIVVEAAGNGNNDLDHADYDTPLNGFPQDWSNPFRRGSRDSGAVLVGAGAPPPGTHGRNHGPDRSRLGFSNYGSAVDVQGWGREVTTAGYGDLQGGSNEDLWYTDRFSGTSSASPIVVGALGCVQGVLRAAGRIPLSPARARSLLRSTGSPQTDAPGRPRAQRIGNRPNLRQLIPAALRTREWIGVQFTGAVPANSTRRWFTHSWPAHWHVVWTVVPTSPRSGGPQIRWDVEVERASDSRITYWISITNRTSDEVRIEARYAVLGW